MTKKETSDRMFHYSFLLNTGDTVHTKLILENSDLEQGVIPMYMPLVYTSTSVGVFYEPLIKSSKEIYTAVASNSVVAYAPLDPDLKEYYETVASRYKFGYSNADKIQELYKRASKKAKTPNEMNALFIDMLDEAARDYIINQKLN